MTPEYTQNFNLYKPNKNDNVNVAQTMADNFQTIDNEIKNRKTEIDDHVASQTAHDAANIVYGTSNVKAALDDAVADSTEALTKATEALNDANVALTNSETALSKADVSEDTANQALSKATQTQKELGEAILYGDSSPLAGQLAIGADGTGYGDAQERFVEEYNRIQSDLADITPAVTRDKPTLSSTLTPLDLTFDVVKIARNQNMKIPVYEDDLTINPNSNNVANYKGISSDNNITWTWSEGKMTFANPGWTRSEVFVQTPITFLGCNFVAEVEVLSEQEMDVPTGKGSGARVGVIKDINNWCIATVDRFYPRVQLVYKANGTIYNGGATTVDMPYAAPYKLMMMVNGDNVNIIVQKDGVYHHILEGYVGANMSFRNPDTLNNWKLCFGANIVSQASKNVVMSNVKGYYTTGMSVGADFHALTYEDGSVIKNNNAIYFTATSHTTDAIGGAGGINIYKLGLNNYDLEFVGKLFMKNTSNGYIYGMGSAKLLYDRNIKSWIFQATDFLPSKPKTYIAKTKRNLLRGVHVIEGQVMNLPDTTVATWDFDIFYDKSINKYVAIYGKDLAGDITVVQATDVLGAWTQTAFAANNGEGNLFAVVGGKRYITRTSASTRKGLDVVKYPELTPLGTIQPSVWCGSTDQAPLCWGNLISVNNGDKTTYYILAFSLNKFANNFYGYGDLWIYKARQESTGLEFDNVDRLFFD